MTATCDARRNAREKRRVYLNTMPREYAFSRIPASAWLHTRLSLNPSLPSPRHILDLIPNADIDYVKIIIPD